MDDITVIVVRLGIGIRPLRLMFELYKALRHLIQPISTHFNPFQLSDVWRT